MHSVAGDAAFAQPPRNAMLVVRLTPQLSCEPDGLDTKRLIRDADGRHEQPHAELVNFSVR